MPWTQIEQAIERNGGQLPATPPTATGGSDGFYDWLISAREARLPMVQIVLHAVRCGYRTAQQIAEAIEKDSKDVTPALSYLHNDGAIRRIGEDRSITNRPIYHYEAVPDWEKRRPRKPTRMPRQFMYAGDGK